MTRTSPPRLGMIFRLTAFGVMGLVIAALGGACGGGDVSCQDYCSQIEGCEQILGGMTCDDFCSQATEANEQTGCGDDFQEFINCADGADDPCQPTDCISEIRAYGDCITCAVNPDDEDC